MGGCLVYSYISDIHMYLYSNVTDPFREGITLLIYSTGQPLCAVSAMRSYVSLVNTFDPAAPLFVNFEGQPLSRTLFVKLLHATLSKAGYDPAKFQAHSFRKRDGKCCICSPVGGQFDMYIGSLEEPLLQVMLLLPNRLLLKPNQLWLILHCVLSFNLFSLQLCCR